MAKQDRLRAMVISAVMAALGLTLPIAFHAAGLGSKFLPMLLPLLLNGFLVPVPWAVLTGALVPLISAVSTGMPPLYPPVAVVMMAEGAVLGGVAALLRRGGRLWLPLIAAIVLGRATAFSLTWALAAIFALPPAMASWAMLIQSAPGVGLQLVVVPLALRMLSKREGPLFAHDS
jgi:hypothetical protein